MIRQHLELEEKHWWFVGRRRIVLDVLKRYLAHGESGRHLDILDAGCGGGATTESLAKYGHVTGLELEESAVEYARERGRKIIQGSVETLPFESDSFDLVLALDVIEHLQDDLPALRELHRVLRPGGLLLVTVPALQMLWSGHDEANGHYRRYTTSGVHRRIASAGFCVTLSTYFNALLFVPILAVRTLWRMRPEKTGSDVFLVPEFLNRILLEIFSFERRVIGRSKLPVGVSALCLAHKLPTTQGRHSSQLS